jgi:hypothetical protein
MESGLAFCLPHTRDQSIHAQHREPCFNSERTHSNTLALQILCKCDERRWLRCAGKRQYLTSCLLTTQHQAIPRILQTIRELMSPPDPMKRLNGFVAPKRQTC